MAFASQRVQHDGATRGRKARIEVPHVGCKSPAESQNLGIARRERQGALVGFTRLREVEGVVRNVRQCELRRGQIRRECERLGRDPLDALL